MKYINNKFYTEGNNPKYIINDGKVPRETSPPKSLKYRYEVMNGVQLDKKSNTIEIDDGSLHIVTK